MKGWVLGLLASVFILSQAATAQAATTVYVNPANTNVGLGSNAVVTINITTDQSVYAAQLDVYYDKTRLNATGAAEGDFLRKDGASTYPVITNDYANGRISYANTRFGVTTGVTGSGGLMTISFNAVASGTSNVGLANTVLVDPNLASITLTTTNGTVKVNRPPSASNPQISPASPTKTSTLTGSYTYSDPDGDPESGTQIRWYKEGVLQAAFNDLNTVPSAAIAKGQRWYFTVRPKDGVSFGATNTSANVTIQNTAPTAPVVAIVPSLPKKADNLLCNITNASTDVDGDVITYSYAWYRNSVLQAITINTVTSGNLTKGQTWNCSVTPNDGTANGPSVSKNVTILNSAPSVSWFAPANTTLKTREGFTLQFNHTSSDPDGDLLTYAWLLDGVQKAATTAWLYSPVAAECGNRTVRLNVSDGAANTNMMWNVSVWLRGDVTLNRIVDIFDLATVGLAYGSTTGGPTWNAKADLNTGPKPDGTPEGDGKIDIFDLATVGLNYGRTC